MAEEKDLTHKAVKLHELPTFRFYMVPQLLFYGKYRELSGNARLLYAMIWDRLSWAERNGWVDKKGYLFVRLARKTAEFKLNISQPTVRSCYKQLEEVGLILRHRNGKTLVDDVYPLRPDEGEATQEAWEQLKMFDEEEAAIFAANPVHF